MSNTYRLGVDIGGTFTDLLVMAERTGETYSLKTPSTVWPVDGVLDGLRELRERHGIGGEQIVYFSHGTTIGVNTLLQRSGARVGMLTTGGFRDTLELRRLRLPIPNDFFQPKPVPLVPRHLVREIDERILANGRVHRPIDRVEVEAGVRELLAEGVEALAVCFLHSYRNPEHELQAKAWAQAAAPDLYVCTSSELWPQQREYERFLIAVMNAHIGGRMRDYFQAIGRETAQVGLRCRVFSTRSNGGVMTAESAAERPVDTLLSGPAAGVIGSAYLGRVIGDERIVTIDIGGTSADMAVIDGEIHYSTENTVGEFPVIMPAVDVSSIGAGGGSIAWVDSEGVLKVGPRSAGANPGPACYGRGGEAPTVTDAYVVAGIIDPAHFLGGTMRLRPDLAEAAIAKLADRLGLTALQTADAILQVTSAALYAELLPEMARRGVDIRDFALLPYGGAGPTQVFMAARDLPVRRIIVPPTPGTMCALGALVADLRADFVRTLWRDSAELTTEGIQTLCRELDGEAHAWIEAQSASVERVYRLRSAEMCYVGQSFDVNVPLPERIEDVTLAELDRRFHERHAALYGHADPGAPTRVIDLRVQVVGVTPKPTVGRIAQAASPQPRAGGAPAAESPASTAAGAAGTRRIFEQGCFQTACVYERSELGEGASIEGPAIVEQYDTTTYIPAGFRVTVDRWHNLIGEKLNREGEPVAAGISAGTASGGTQ